MTERAEDTMWVTLIKAASTAQFRIANLRQAADEADEQSRPDIAETLRTVADTLESDLARWWRSKAAP